MEMRRRGKLVQVGIHPNQQRVNGRRTSNPSYPSAYGNPGIRRSSARIIPAGVPKELAASLHRGVNDYSIIVHQAIVSSSSTNPNNCQSVSAVGHKCNNNNAL